MKHYSLRSRSMFAVLPAGRAVSNRIVRNAAIAALLGLLAVSGGVANAENLIKNGNFCTANPCTTDPPPVYGPVADWTASNPNSGSGNDYSAFAGTQSLSTLPGSPTSYGFLQETYGVDPASFSQSLVSPTGAGFYTLSFYQSTRAGYDDPLVTVSINGTALESAVDISFDSGWTFESFDYGAIIPEMTVTFTNASTGSDSSALFTEVSLVSDGLIASSPSATPEPSSLVLLGTGLVGAAGAARRRFRKA